MSDTMNPTSRTYTTTETWRASEIDGGGHLVRTETVHADGRVGWSVKGTADGEYVNESGTRSVDLVAMPVNFARIDAARTSSGWTVAAS